ncbi:MAG: DNA polymerase IV [Candidatus Omnitrophota bacterium]
MNQKKILHLDMDAFFASIEQAINPKLKGRPVIVGGRKNQKRTVVCAASYEAKKLGIDSGMSTQAAFKICPEAEFVAADSTKYLYTSRQIYKLLTNYSPQIEQGSIDEFYLDITGMDKTFGSYLNLGQSIKTAIKKKFDITGSIGISLNRLISKIASKLNKPDGLIMLEKENIKPVLADLKIEKIPGIGPSLTAKLNLLSVFYFKDIEKISLDFLYKKFGKVGIWLYALTHPEEDGQGIHWISDPKELPKSIGHSYTLAQNIYKQEDIQGWFRLLSEMVGTRLRQIGLEASTISIYIRKADMKAISCEKNFKSFVNNSGDLFQRVLFILDKLKLRNISVRALGVSARNLNLSGNNFLFESDKKKYNVDSAQDKINEKYGDWTLYPASIMKIFS